MYAAIHNIRLGGKLITPGEIIQHLMTEREAQRLLAKGAIRAMADTGPSPNQLGGENTDATGGDPGGQEEPESKGDGATNEGEGKTGEDDEEEVDGEPPEIDVMAGVVAPAKEVDGSTQGPAKPGRGRKKA